MAQQQKVNHPDFTESARKAFVKAVQIELGHVVDDVQLVDLMVSIATRIVCRGTEAAGLEIHVVHEVQEVFNRVKAGEFQVRKRTMDEEASSTARKRPAGTDVRPALLPLQQVSDDELPPNIFQDFDGPDALLLSSFVDFEASPQPMTVDSETGSQSGVTSTDSTASSSKQSSEDFEAAEQHLQQQLQRYRTSALHQAQPSRDLTPVVDQLRDDQFYNSLSPMRMISRAEHNASRQDEDHDNSPVSGRRGRPVARRRMTDPSAS